MRNAPRIDLYRTGGSEGIPGDWYWRLWKGSRIVAASSQGYTERRGAVENLEFVLGGKFGLVGSPDPKAPFGLVWRLRDGHLSERIPVRLLP